MITKTHKSWIGAATILTLASFSGLVAAQSAGKSSADSPQVNGSMPANKYETAAVKHVNDAVAVVRRMESAPRMKAVLQQAKGVFIVPSYGRAALGVGGRGGSGVLLVKREDGTWSDPAFYNIGGINIGLQAGAEGGPIAMALNNDKAVNRFMQKNNFSLSADTGITVINWTKLAEGSTGSGDVVVWSGTKGLFGDVVTLGVSDIRFNHNLNDAYYHQALAAGDVIHGKVKNPHADMLKQELASISSGSTSTGSQGDTGRAGTSESGK